MAFLPPGSWSHWLGAPGRVWLYVIMVTSGRGLVEGNRRWRLAGLRLPEDKLKASSFLLASNELTPYGADRPGFDTRPGCVRGLATVITAGTGRSPAPGTACSRAGFTQRQREPDTDVSAGPRASQIQLTTRART